MDKDLGRLLRLEWYNWDLCAESLEISESDNVIVCTMINETVSAKTRMQAHYSSLGEQVTSQQPR